MSGNTIKEQAEEPETGAEAAAPEKSGGNRVGRFFSSIMDGRAFKGENAAKQITFFCFLALVAVVYIGNGYYAQKTLRESNNLSNDIKNMQGEYVNLQSKLAEKTRLSMIAKQAAGVGLREASIPPAKLIVNTQTKK
jgi:hypothetical protein